MPTDSWAMHTLSAPDDADGGRVPDGAPAIVDAHVHVFPKRLFEAVWGWFGEHAWPIRYQMDSEELIQYLLSRGVAHVVALQYAHKEGIAGDLNRYMADLCRRFRGKVTGMATVFPGEPDAETVLMEAFDMGLSGVKLHTHVQCFDMSSRELYAVCDLCAREGKPMVIHAGREPVSPAYRCDPYQLCSAAKLEAILKTFPQLKICVPHLGMNEFDAYGRLIEAYDTLWLDTTMALGDFFPLKREIRLDELRTDRIMYGTDFPNIPYAWDRELKKLMAHSLAPDALSKILGENASAFYNID